MNAEHRQNVIPQKCPVCSAERDHLSYVPLVQDRARAVVHLTCDACASNVIAFISHNDMGVVSVGIVADVDAQEAKHFLTAQPVSDEDILGIHAAWTRKKPLHVQDIVCK